MNTDKLQDFIERTISEKTQASSIQRCTSLQMLSNATHLSIHNGINIISPPPNISMKRFYEKEEEAINATLENFPIMIFPLLKKKDILIFWRVLPTIDKTHLDFSGQDYFYIRFRFSFGERSTPIADDSTMSNPEAK